VIGETTTQCLMAPCPVMSKTVAGNAPTVIISGRVSANETSQMAATLQAIQGMLNALKR
jgi:hypothetical protein